MKRYFIVSPGNSDEDTLWQLCSANGCVKSKDTIMDIYNADEYNVIASSDNKAEVKRVAKRFGSKNPRII